jgi:hypothetical protein
MVVIGAVVNHVNSPGQQAEHARDGGQPPFAQSPWYRRPSCHSGGSLRRRASPVRRLRWPSGLSANREDRAEAWT